MKDEWVAAALSDDSVVVDLLFRLKQSSSSQLPKPPLLFLPQGWGKHQPRSRSAVPANSGKKDSAVTSSTTRCSPTTPLSWCGGGGGAASPSDGNCDGHSGSCLALSDLSRSKDECTNNSSISNSARKKKTFCELEEESLLLKDRVNLNKELASMQVTVQQQRARSQNVKRIKLDLNIVQQSANEMVGTSGDPLTEVVSTGNDHNHSVETRRRHAKDEKFGSQSSCPEENEVILEAQPHTRCFVLPDLNIMPEEGDVVWSKNSHNV